MDANDSAFGCVAIDDILSLEEAIFIHAYTFASFCIILVIISVIISIKMLRSNHNTKFLLTIESLMIIFGLLRAMFLLTDPYRVRNVLPPLVVQFLEDLAVPCLTSALMLVQNTFWQLTKTKRLKLQRVPVLLGTVAAHFLLIAVIDIVVINVAGKCELLLVCQALTTLWGLILSVGFFVTVRNLHLINRQHRNTLFITAVDKLHLQRASEEGSLTSPIGLSVNHEGGDTGGNPSTDTPAIASIQSISLVVKENENKQQCESQQVLQMTNSSHPSTELATKTKAPIPKWSPRRLKTFGRKPNPLLKVMIVSMMTSFLGLLCFVLGVYGMIVFNNPLQPVSDVKDLLSSALESRCPILLGEGTRVIGELVISSLA
ncbi:uncharacterized protein LOC110979207 isoform X2 [Acanthaster planci]|uniref:Uncharacterized protein LOC110979207 isoform X2 n=1 Tax=Acanthaster planci TaxID=133434 RepID=A0A8B7YBA4_ACAPL|nr:uncharacterized protein LOC110979207 isoform X2 [Acanthaster planci]